MIRHGTDDRPGPCGLWGPPLRMRTRTVLSSRYGYAPGLRGGVAGEYGRGEAGVQAGRDFSRPGF